MAGYGQIGYCRCCASSLRAEIDARLLRESAPSIIAWAKARGFSVSKPTLLKHKRHIGHPLRSFVDQASQAFADSESLWRAGFTTGYGEGFEAGRKAGQ
jgi:hypothetical protein